tara:strand:- start:98240 stop:99115 length:876 start_codon:yes stop_codon:yes gene_type:complete
MTRPTIISLGEVLWDLFPAGARFGGAPANFACHAAILGGNVAIVSAVGDDERGREAISILSKFNVDVSLVQTTPDAATGTVGVELDENHKPDFTIHADSAWDRIEWKNEIDAKIRSADAVYFGTLGQRSEISRNTIQNALDAAKQAGVARIVDINLRPPFFDDALIIDSIQLASILKLSDDELPQVCQALQIKSDHADEETLREILNSQSLDMVVMTRGAKGAVLVTADGTVDHPGVPADVKDTVGAGDSFTAAFLIGVLRGDPPKTFLGDACRVAAKVCGHVGAVPDTTS